MEYSRRVGQITMLVTVDDKDQIHSLGPFVRGLDVIVTAYLWYTTAILAIVILAYERFVRFFLRN